MTRLAPSALRSCLVLSLAVVSLATPLGAASGEEGRWVGIVEHQPHAETAWTIVVANADADADQAPTRIPLQRVPQRWRQPLRAWAQHAMPIVVTGRLHDGGIAVTLAAVREDPPDAVPEHACCHTGTCCGTPGCCSGTRCLSAACVRIAEAPAEAGAADSHSGRD